MSHRWGDDWPYWEDLYEAERYIQKTVRRYGLCYISMKEKYGTLRYEHIFPRIGTRNFKWGENPSWIVRVIRNCCLRLGHFVLKRSIVKAIQRWPQCKDEILSDASIFNDYSGKPMFGEEIMNQYWKKV